MEGALWEGALGAWGHSTLSPPPPPAALTHLIKLA